MLTNIGHDLIQILKFGEWNMSESLKAAGNSTEKLLDTIVRDERIRLLLDCRTRQTRRLCKTYVVLDVGGFSIRTMSWKVLNSMGMFIVIVFIHKSITSK